MIANTKKLLSVLVLTASLAGVSACAEKDPSRVPGAPGEAGISPVSPNFIYAEGWTDLTIDALSAVIKVDTLGHLETDKNMCMRRGFNVYKLDAWNKLSTALNQVVLTAPLATPRCSDSSNGSKLYNRGMADLVLDRAGKRALFEYKNGQICSSVADPALSDQLLELIEQSILLAERADAQECPNYRP